MNRVNLGLIGNPLSHTFSPGFFAQKFMQKGIDYIQYLPYELTDIADVIALIKEKNLSGFNVTIPFKEKIVPLCHELSPEARAIGAVNCVVVKRKHNQMELIGHNTDCIGFELSIQKYAFKPTDRALIIGSGGSAKAVSYALKKMGLTTAIASRDESKGQFIYGADIPLEEFAILVQCSPVGMYPNSEECPEIPYQRLQRGQIVYDLIYNPAKTRFLQNAWNAGCRTQNGLEMLIHQAEESWEIWKRFELFEEPPDNTGPKT